MQAIFLFLLLFLISHFLSFVRSFFFHIFFVFNLHYLVCHVFVVFLNFRDSRRRRRRRRALICITFVLKMAYICMCENNTKKRVNGKHMPDRKR